MTDKHSAGFLSAILNRDRRGWRFFVLLAVIAALVGVTAAAGSPAHFHSKAAGCDLCLTASLAASAEISEVHSLVVPEARKKIAEAPLAVSRYSLLLLDSSQTRGPPAIAL